ncbi:MAG TPA: glycosyl hydrolase family 18 protein [Acidobacteriaceae bacterium]|nr:glycosyl hydrolase family 18 protein [Acidobacteriaceae bacterium]
MAQSAPPPPPHLIAYLFAGKQSNYTTLLATLQFGKITDLDLAFANPPQCQGVCTAASDRQFSIEGETDADIDSLVRAAHAAGVRVLASIGGGGGDQRIIQFYNAGLSVPLVASLQTFVAAHALDGVDLDIEDPSNMGAPYLTFTTALTAAFHPEGKLVTAAVAPYLQASMPEAALRQFDLLNIMNYSSSSAAVAALNFYAVQEKIPPAKLVLGVPFFGSSDNDTREESYKNIMAAYPNAWKVDLAGGGPLDDGLAFHYVGESTMVVETQLGKKYGGIMFWDLTDDAPAPHSLLTLIEANF